MKIVMISQPMRNKTEEEIISVKEKAKKELESKGYDVIDTHIKDYKDIIKLKVLQVFDANEDIHRIEQKNLPIFYLSKSIERMAECDAVYFVKGWEEARGCKIEHEIAKQYGLEIMYEE